METLPLVILVITAAGVIAYSIYSKMQLQNMLRELASRLRLKEPAPSFFEAPKLEGVVEGHKVNFYRKDFSHGKTSTSTLAFEIDLLDASLPSFSISAEGLVSGINRFFGDDDIRTGDAEFDKKMLIESTSSIRLLSLLSSNARLYISACMRDSYDKKFEVSDQRIIQYIKLYELDSVDDIIIHLNGLLRLADILKRKGTPKELLVENFMSEKLPQCKKVFLEKLCILKARFTLEDPLIKKSLEDGDPETRFLAAKLLGKDGIAIIKDLFTRSSDELKTEIIQHFANEKEIAIMEFLLKNANSESVVVLSEIANYCSLIKSDKAEPFLLRELQRCLSGDDSERDKSYGLKLIEALASCGTFKSIEVLYGVKSLALKRDAEKAIATIQDRIGTGDAGWLSMHENDDSVGMLSISENESDEKK